MVAEALEKHFSDWRLSSNAWPPCTEGPLVLSGTAVVAKYFPKMGF